MGAARTSAGAPAISGTGRALTDSAEPYVLFVGTLEPRKGLDLVLGALGHAAAAGVRLVIAGAAGWGGVSIAEGIRARGLDPARVTVRGRVDDATLAQLMQNARALVLPSRAEGFGLPLVEAMALGTPVILSDDPALVETAGGAGLCFAIDERVHTTEARLAHALARLWNDADLRDALSARGTERARSFSWDSSARAVLSLFREL